MQWDPEKHVAHTFERRGFFGIPQKFKNSITRFRNPFRFAPAHAPAPAPAPALTGPPVIQLGDTGGDLASNINTALAPNHDRVIPPNSVHSASLPNSPPNPQPNPPIPSIRLVPPSSFPSQSPGDVSQTSSLGSSSVGRGASSTPPTSVQGSGSSLGGITLVGSGSSLGGNTLDGSGSSLSGNTLVGSGGGGSSNSLVGGTNGNA
jgi:hypothetical protein